MSVRREGQKSKIWKHYMENTKWIKKNLNISQQFIQLEQVTTLGTGIGAVGDQ